VLFTELIVRPIFNLIVFIYAILPGHNFGMAIIIFTILVRLALWPLVKKQLHHAKAIRALQPEIKKIKASAKGDKRKESMLTMELYKERQINPFSSIGLLIVQIPIFIGLYYAIKRIIENPQQMIDFAYPFVQNLPWMEQLAKDISQFDETLFGFINLGQAAVSAAGVYWPAMILVLGSATAQFFQSKMLLPKDKDARSLRRILSDAGKGKSSDQQEVSAAVGRGTVYIIPFFIFMVTVRLASALSLYWLTSALVAIIQQKRVLGQDETEMSGVVSNVGETGGDSMGVAGATQAVTERTVNLAVKQKVKRNKKYKNAQTQRKKRKKR
jgi:YidC/Oxa1 family membrane protein insertase